MTCIFVQKSNCFPLKILESILDNSLTLFVILSVYIKSFNVLEFIAYFSTEHVQLLLKFRKPVHDDLSSKLITSYPL